MYWKYLIPYCYFIKRRGELLKTNLSPPQIVLRSELTLTSVSPTVCVGILTKLNGLLSSAEKESPAKIETKFKEMCKTVKSE